MSVQRLKSSFTAGELSPLLSARIDNDRYKNGCRRLRNMHVKTQGPVSRRTGFRFIYDISSLGANIDVRPRLVPFIFSRTQSYTLIFFKHSSGNTRVAFGSGNGLVEDPDNVGTPYVFEFSGVMDIEEFKYAQSADVLFITQPTRMPIAFTRMAHANWSAVEISVTTPPFIMNDTTTTVASSATAVGTTTLTASAALFDTGFVGQKIKMGGGIITITGYTSPTVVTGTIILALTSGDATLQWYSQEWGPIYGYPRFVGFYEQRIFFASNAARPQTIWFSRSGMYYDFSISSPIVASDALTFTLDSGTQNKVQWILAARQLILGTLGDEWSMGGSGYEPLSFSTVRASRHTNHGGEDLQPLMIGPVVLFLEVLGRTINQMVYDFNSDSYTTVDLSVLAPHLTDNFTIIDWDYQQTPNGIVWAVREDGALLGLTFKREHNVTGWHVHDTQGEFKSVACIPGTKENDVWVIVKRQIGGVWKYYVEKKVEEFLSIDVMDSKFLDCFLEYSGPAVQTLSGLEHLEGMTVDVFGSGYVFSDYKVLNGEITLPVPVSVAVIGLRYVSELVPQMQEYDTKSGSTYARVRRTDHIDVSLYLSQGMEFGRYTSQVGYQGISLGEYTELTEETVLSEIVEINEEYAEEIPFRTPDMDVSHAIPLFTGTLRATFPNGYDVETFMFIRQSQPLPMTVISIVDNVDIKE